MLDAVIFDFDGVIADDERLHLTGFRQALASHGITLSDVEYFERYIGYDDREGFAAMLEDHGQRADAQTVARLMVDKARVFRELVRERVRIFSGVRELLEDLRAGDRRTATAIGSGALRSEVDLVLGIADLAAYFDTIVCADDVARGKPHPDIYLRVLERLSERQVGLRAEDCVVIEDSAAGIEAATAAGMRTIAVTNSHPASYFQADLIVASLEELDRARCAGVIGRETEES